MVAETTEHYRRTVYAPLSIPFTHIFPAQGAIAGLYNIERWKFNPCIIYLRYRCAGHHQESVMFLNPTLVGMQLSYFSQPQLTSMLLFYPETRVPVMYSINHSNDEPHQLQCIGVKQNQKWCGGGRGTHQLHQLGRT